MASTLVLLYGVRWLLEAKCFPFTKYAVEYGHGNKSAFDVIAEANGERLTASGGLGTGCAGNAGSPSHCGSLGGTRVKVS